jgi:hypothetical protein
MAESKGTRDHHKRVAVFENRPQYRVSWGCDAKFVVDGNETTARIVSMGLGGLRVDFPTELNIGQLIEAHFALPTKPDSEPEILVVNCQVVWALFEHLFPPYPTGLKIRELDAKTRRSLIRLLVSINQED